MQRSITPFVACTLLAAALHGQSEVSVGERSTYSFQKEPQGLPGLKTLEELRGTVLLMVCADPADTAAFKKLTAAIAKLAKRYGHDLNILILAPEAEASWREAYAQRCFLSGAAMTTEPPVAIPSEKWPFAVVLNPFGEVVHADSAAKDLDDAQRAIETATTAMKSAEAYAPAPVAAAWRMMEKGSVQAGLDELRTLARGSDAMQKQAAETALEWWTPRSEGSLARAERLIAGQRWSEAEQLLTSIEKRFPGITKAQDVYAEKFRSMRSAIPRKGAELTADQELFALSEELIKKGPTKAVREKLTHFLEVHAEQKAAERARVLQAQIAL